MKKRVINILVCMLFVATSCSCSEEQPPVEPVGPGGPKEEIEILEHPRLLFTADEEDRVKKLMITNPTVAGLVKLLQRDADKLLTINQLAFVKDDGGSILEISREYVYRLFTLSLAHRLLDREKYVGKIEETLNHICDYPEWGENHFLDVAEMTTAVAVAYDWVFTALSADTRLRVKAAIHTRALSVALEEYRVGNENSWAKRETNWNVVCNAGMTLGAIALGEDYPEIMESIVKNSAKYMPECLKHFAPDGVCYEGPSYWGYTNVYLSLFLKAANDNFGEDYGISDLPGVSKSAQFYIKTISPAGRLFNFADSNETTPFKSPCFFAFSSLYDQPEVAAWYRKQLEDIVKNSGTHKWHFYLSIPWFDDSQVSGISEYPLLDTYHGINDIFVFRGKEGTDKPIYLIGKGAAPDMAHQQMDGGTFVIETEGIRWTDDLGVDEYNLPGFWDYSQEGLRWNYFRNTNMAHNTLIIDGKLQYSRGRANIVEEDANADQPYVMLDMTSLYESQVKKLTRKFTMINNQTMQVKDLIELTDAGSEVTWSMVTSANVLINGNTVTLEKGGKKFYLKIKSPLCVGFTSKPAAPNTSGERPITGVTIVQASVQSSDKDVEIVVEMSTNNNIFSN